jgi:GntR family transcriptional repressor for pyruvate dehydrogenase complex
MIEPLVKVNLSDMVVRKIQDLIAYSSYKPGDKLPPAKELAKLFGIGYTTLREGLKKLQALGLIELRHGAGIFLKKDCFDVFIINPVLESLDKDTLIDLIHVRKIIETESVRLAVKNASEEDLEKLRELLNKMKENLNDSRQFIKYNVMFHIAVGQASGNKVLQEMISALAHLISKEQEAIFADMPGLERKGYIQHKNIYRALKERDEDKAVKSMETHLEKVKQELFSLSSIPAKRNL